MSSTLPNARRAADRARTLAETLRNTTDDETLRVIADRLDMAAAAFADTPPPILDGVTITNTLPAEAMLPLWEARSLAEDAAPADCPPAVLDYITAPITGRFPAAPDASTDKEWTLRFRLSRAAARLANPAAGDDDVTRAMQEVLDVYRGFARVGQER